MVNLEAFFSPGAHLGQLNNLEEKQPARLGELCCNLLPLFCYK